MRRGGALIRARRVTARLAWLATCIALAGAAHAESSASSADGQSAGTSGGATPAARLLATARMWSAKHRDDLARQAMRKALLIAPDDAVLLGEAIRIDLRLGDARTAQTTLARLKTLAPNAPATLRLEDEFHAATNGREELAMIRLYARSGQNQEATRRLTVLFPHGAPPGALGAEYYRILAGTPAGYTQAVAALRERVAADSSDTEAALALVALLDDRTETRDEANRLAWRLACRNDVDHPAAMNAWRKVLSLAGEDPAYLDALRAYLSMVPGDSEFGERVAHLQARLEAQRALEREPDYIAEQQGLRALARGDLAAADPLLSRAAQNRARDEQAVGGLGLVRLRQARHAEARELFQRAAALNGVDHAKWESLARTALLWGTLAQGRQAAEAGRPQDAERAAKVALSMDESNTQAKLMLADAWLAERNWQAAEPLLRELLRAREPSLSAARSMETLLQNTGRADEVDPLLDALQTRFHAADERAGLARLRADALANDAQRLAAAGKRGPAAQRYEAALRVAPDASWTRFALARLYRDLGLPQLGRAVMDEGIAVSSTPEMRYAGALYRNSVDDVAGAQAVLAPVPEAARSEGMHALARRLDAEQALANARRAFANSAQDAALDALDALERARTLGADDPSMTASIAALLIDEGQADRGLTLMRDWMAEHPREVDADVRLRYGDLLGSARRDDTLRAWLDDLRGDPHLTAEQTQRLEDQALRLVLRETDAALEQRDFARARHRLAQASTVGKRDKRYALELADLERAQGHYAAAQAALASVLARTPDDADAQLALARVFEQSGQQDEALAIVERVLEATPPEDVETRLSAARRLAALRRPAEAERITSALLDVYPARPDVTVEAGRLAAETGHYEQAAALYRVSLTQERAAGIGVRGADATPAQAALDDLEQRRDPEVEVGWMPAYKSGDAGVSDYHAQQVPVYVQIPYRYDGHFFVHLDAVHLDAGTLDVTNPQTYALQTFGTYSAFVNSGTTLPPVGDTDLHQRANGVAIGTGYTSDAWRFDVGTTPLGFPVHFLVGGARYRFDAGPASFSVSASRRPETSSELSYAGLRDPWTHAVWGGVRRDGVDWRMSIDIGRVNVFSEVGAGELTGRHVADNQEITLRTGFTVPVYERANMRFNTGLVGNAWHYTRNLRFYTYGQGGYYSPQRYLSLGVPIEWAGKQGGLKWDVTTTVGVSNSYEKNSPYYPDGLPSGAGLPPGQSFGNLVHAGGSSALGFSYGVSGMVQYRFNGHVVVGARVAIDHAHDYAPSSAMVYMRYSFNARKDDDGFWLSPVRLYSSY